MELIESIDTFLFDCDGVLWHDDYIIEGVNEALHLLHSLKKRCIFVTNCSTKSRSSLLNHFHSLGFDFITKEDIFCSSYATALFLKKTQLPDTKVFVIGDEGMTEELSIHDIPFILAPSSIPTSTSSGSFDMIEEEIEEYSSLDLKSIGAVLIGFDYHFNYKKLALANRLLRHSDDQGNHPVLFLATNLDNAYVSKHGIFPGTGCMIQSVIHASEREPIVLGKPSQDFFSIIKEAVRFDPSRTIMVGDRLDTDILFGNLGGLKTLLVLSGICTMKKLESAALDLIPTHFASSLGHLAKLYLD